MDHCLSYSTIDQRITLAFHATTSRWRDGTGGPSGAHQSTSSSNSISDGSVQLLRRLMQDIEAKRYFNEAVDPEALGIPEYRTIIKEPMDLGLIFWKLKDSTYSDVAAFFDDLHLVWRNCQTFNLQGSPVYEASEKLNRQFETWWNKSRRDLGLDSPQFEFHFENLHPHPIVPELESSRGRRLIAKKTDDGASLQLPSSPLSVTKSSGSKLKIRLGRGFKREHPTKSKGSLFGKAKEHHIDAETAKRLECCISILERLLTSHHAVALEQAALQPTFVPSLSDIHSSLTEAKLRNWIRSPYASSKDVLHEAGLYLRSQAVKNDQRKRITTAITGLLKALEKQWMEADLGHDVEALKATDDPSSVPDSNLRVTKARMEKLKRQEMEKEVKQVEEAIAALEQTKSEIEGAKGRLDRAKDGLKEATRNWNVAYRQKLAQLTELSKSKSLAQKQKEKAQAAVKAAQVAIERLKEKELVLERLKQEEQNLLSAREAEASKLEVLPKDAVLVDIRHYAKKPKAQTDTTEAYLRNLGDYWLSMI